MMSKGRRQKLKGGDEWDVVGSWRKYYCYLQRSGVCKAIKAKMNRRERREAKQQLKEELDDL